jgi:hypothetical protein
MGETKSGVPYVAVLLEVVDGEFAGETSYWNAYLSDKAAEFSLAGLKVLGWDGEDLTTLDGLGTGVAEVVFQSETYNGKTSVRPRFINEVGKRPGMKIKGSLGDDRRREIAEKFGAVKKQAGPAF